VDDRTVVDRETRRAIEEPLLLGKRYRPLALLGSGGMGTVYLARDDELDELVAVKVLRPELLGASAMLTRFRDEVRLSRRVSSPFVARTHDLGEHDGRFFVTMQYVEGETLSERIRREGRIPAGDAVAIARDICRGLGAVHEAGIVHRDLKPGNVLLARDGRAVLTDFGIAVRAGPAAAHTDGSGTPTYAAPEQLAGGALDARTDVFAFGAMLFVMLTGQRPFPAARTGREPPPDPRRVAGDVPDALAAVVIRAMALDARDRFESCAALAGSLEGVRAPVALRSSELSRFARSLAARSARRLSLRVDVAGANESLARAVRVDLANRLDAAGAVRAVPSDGEAELTGRIAVDGGEAALELAMTSAAEGYVFWTEAFRGPLATLPQLVERAARAIERAFVPASAATSDELSFPSAEVAQLFFEARVEYRAFWKSRVAKSVELFERARSLAPDHPLLLAWCAAAYARLGFFDTSHATGDLGHELALRAVAGAPTCAEARVALASMHMQQMRVVEAVPHFVEALRIAPGLLEQRSHFARVVAECGAAEPARLLAESALEIDPNFAEPVEVLMRPHALRGHMDRAAGELARVTEGNDVFLRVTFGRYCLWNRDHAAFEAKCASLDWSKLDEQPRRLLETVRAVLFGEARSVEALAELAVGPPRRVAFVRQMVAELAAAQRDEARALDSIESAFDAGLFDVQWMDGCPLFDPMRGTPRFESMRRAVHERAMAVIAEIERRLA